MTPFTAHRSTDRDIGTAVRADERFWFPAAFQELGLEIPG
jgi:hypothetical protein